MKWWYSPFELEPLKKLNGRSSLAPRSGMYLKNESGQITEYVPWPEFGDLSVSEFIKKPPTLLWQHLQSMAELAMIPQDPRPFLNHQLFTPSDEINGSYYVAKIKLTKNWDKAIESIEKASVKTWRIDFNQSLNLEEFIIFLNSIPEELREKIEYIEDPFPYHKKIWAENFGIPLALDLVGSDEDFPLQIYKPMVQAFPERAKKIIFSSYMGSWLGMWQSYLELLKHGNLDLYHGIVTPGLYDGEVIPFNRGEGDWFNPNMDLVESELEKLKQREWIPWI